MSITGWRYYTNREYVREVDREANAARREYKRTWEREHDFAICACGNKTGSKRLPRCQECYHAEQAEGQRAKDAIVEQMWAEGYLLKDIGAILGVTRGAIGCRIHRLRAQGRAPYRNSYPGKVA